MIYNHKNGCSIYFNDWRGCDCGDITYQSGDAINSRKLKEVGLTWEQYQKACLSVEEFIRLFKRSHCKIQMRRA